jgi:hypothetical protein
MVQINIFEGEIREINNGSYHHYQNIFEVLTIGTFLHHKIKYDQKDDPKQKRLHATGNPYLCAAQDLHENKENEEPRVVMRKKGGFISFTKDHVCQ